MDGLDRLRKSLSSPSHHGVMGGRVGNEGKGEGAGKITYLPLLVKIMSLALREFPTLNCRVVESEKGVEVEERDGHCFSVAVDTPKG